MAAYVGGTFCNPCLRSGPWDGWSRRADLNRRSASVRRAIINSENRTHFCTKRKNRPPAIYWLTDNGEQYSILHVIRSFRSAETERLFRRQPSRKFRSVARPALRKLDMLDAANSLGVLSTLPGNRLEKLRGDREGQHSIRINNQWRICFVWRDGDAHQVEIADYH